jgi:ATP-dependent Clp protease ATP-binding subunit ClpA
MRRLTPEARDAVARARHAARERHAQLGTEYLLLALAQDGAGVATMVLRQAGVDEERVRTGLDALTTRSGRMLDDQDRAALATIGIDLDAVLARLDESFGGQSGSPGPDRRELLRRGRSGARGLTPRARKVMALSLREAIRLGHPEIGTGHLLLALVRDANGLGAAILTRAGVDPDVLRRATLAALDRTG